MNNFTITRFLSILLVLFLVSCSLDHDKLTNPDLPYWTTHLEIPLMTLSFGVDEIMKNVDDPDSAITKIPKSSDGDSILYAFQKTEEIPEDTITFPTGIDPFGSNIVSELGIIELAPIPEQATPPFTLSELTGFSAGIDKEIPSGRLTTIEKTFTFTSFEYATFETGVLNVNINNQLPIALTEVNIILKNIDGVVIDDVNIAEVPAGEIGQGNINLVSKTLYSNIFVEVDANTPGSPLAVNISGYFEVLISSGDLEVSSAKAEIPEQSSPIEGNGNMELSGSDHRVSKAVFDKGKLHIKIINQLDLSSELIMQIPSIQDGSFNSEPMLITLPKQSTVDTLFDLKEKYMVLYEGNDFSEFLTFPQIVQYSYSVFLESPSDFRTVSKTDKINVSFNFYGDEPESSISFSQITGKIAEQRETIGPITQHPPDLPPEMDDFLLLNEWVDMSLFIQIDNIGLPILVDLTITAENQDTAIIRSQSHDFSISPEMRIDNSAELINIRPESIEVNGEAIVGDSTEFSTINIVDAVYMKGYFSINIPFVFKVNPGTVVELDPELSTPDSFEGLPVDIENIKSMQLLIDYDNQLGFGADVSVLAASDTTYFADSSSVKPDTLIKSLFLNNNAQSKDSLILNEKQMKLFSDSIYIITNVNLFGDEIFFLSTDSLILKLSASMEYLINAPDSTGTPDE